MFAVALMQPAPPARIVSRCSELAKTSKFSNRSIIVRLFDYSPELSLIPAPVPGYSFRRRSIRSSVIGTRATGGM